MKCRLKLNYVIFFLQKAISILIPLHPDITIYLRLLYILIILFVHNFLLL